MRGKKLAHRRQLGVAVPGGLALTIQVRVGHGVAGGFRRACAGRVIDIVQLEEATGGLVREDEVAQRQAAMFGAPMANGVLMGGRIGGDEAVAHRSRRYAGQALQACMGECSIVNFARRSGCAREQRRS